VCGHRHHQGTAAAKERLKRGACPALVTIAGSVRQPTGKIQPTCAISAWAVTHTGVCALVRE
jgi:hypothetical protein